LARRGVVAHDAAQRADVLAAERRAARRDGRRHAREVARHDVGVALDDHDPLGVAARDVALREVEPIEHLVLLVDRRLGRVEVLRPLVVVEQLARAEADRLARHIADRPHDPAAEPVVHSPALVRQHEARRHELVAREALAREVVQQVIPPARRVPDAEVARGAGVEAALTEERARGLGLWRQQLLAEELGRLRVRGVQARATARLGRGAAALLVVQLVSDALRDLLDRLGEREVVHLAQERVDVPRFAAPEAVIEPLAGAHIEARALLVVEGAEPLQGADARRLQRDALADDVGDVRARLDLVDVGLDDARHYAITCAARIWIPTSAGSMSPTSRACHATAVWSVRLATWSTMTRLRSASVSARTKSSAKTGSS